MKTRNDIVGFLEEIFTEKEKEAPRGRQEGPRRPERSTKAGYQGRGYSGPGGAMQGRGGSNEQPAPKLPGEDPEEKKNQITEFDSVDDWVLSMILVALMHANPDISPDDAIKSGKELAKKLYMPRMEHIWKTQTSRIRRFGIRAEASKIRRELFKLI